MKSSVIKFFQFIAVALFVSMTAAAQNDVEKDFFVDDPSQQSLPAKPTEPAKPAPQDKPTELTKPRLNYTDPTGAESHPLFDWSKHQNETLVTHPLADKGLVEITKDKVYIYNVKPSEQHHAATFHVGMYNPSNLKNPDAEQSATFGDNYAPNNPIFMIDYEWQLWRMAIGKIGITAGSGLYFAQGHGHFVHPDKEPPGLVPKETFSLAVFPTSVGAIYRVQMWDRQLFVPFGSGGGTLFPFTEFRDDGYGPRFGGSIGAYVSAGCAFNLTYFDKLAAVALDREYGINRMYLVAELREIINLSPHYDFSGTILNAGFTAEF